MRKSVTQEEWVKANNNLQEWRKNKAGTTDLDIYHQIISKVHVGKIVADIGCGHCNLFKALEISGKKIWYSGYDPFPVVNDVFNESAEDLINDICVYDTVFMLAALDNVRDLNLALKGLKHIARENIVIFTGIDIEPDKNHTIKVTRKDLIEVLGEPTQEIEFRKNVYLFEWKL